MVTKGRNMNKLFVSAAALAAMLFAALPLAGHAAGVGPTIAIGSLSASNGKVVVPVETRGEGFVPYTGWSIHLRWDPAVFSFDSAAGAGPFAGSGAICAGPTADADGAGTVLSCSLVGNAAQTSSGSLATFTLAPKGNGCSALHITTLGPPDGGDTTTGSYTIEQDGDPSDPVPSPQVNAYIDAAADASGAPCGSSAPPTVAAGIPTNVPPATAIPPQAITPAPAGQQTAQPGATAPVSLQPGAAATFASAATANAGTPHADGTPATLSTSQAPGTPLALGTARRGITSGQPTAGVQASKQSKDSGSNRGLIIGIGAAVVVVLLAVAGSAWWYQRRA